MRQIVTQNQIERKHYTQLRMLHRERYSGVLVTGPRTCDILWSGKVVVQRPGVQKQNKTKNLVPFQKINLV